MNQYKITSDVDSKVNSYFTSNSKKSVKDVIDDLKKVNSSFSTQDSVEMPESPNFTRMENVEIDEDKIKENAITELNDYKNKSINNIENNFENQKQELNNNLEVLKNTAQENKDVVKQNFETLRENANNDALKRGLQRSSIVINTMDAFNNKEIDTYNAIDKELSNNINAINFELNALNSSYEEALNNFDIEYAAKLSEKISSATNKLKEEQEKVIKYNNEIASKEAEFNKSLTKLEQEMNESSWDKEHDILELYGKYGTMVVDKFKANKMYDITLNYLSNFSKDEAISILLTNPEFKTLLGETNYFKVMDKFR